MTRQAIRTRRTLKALGIHKLGTTLFTKKIVHEHHHHTKEVIKPISYYGWWTRFRSLFYV